MAILAARLKAPVFVADAGLLGAAVPLLLSSLGPVALDLDPVRAWLDEPGVDGNALMSINESYANQCSP